MEELLASKDGRLEGLTAIGPPVLLKFYYNRCKSEFNGVPRPLLEPFDNGIVPKNATYFVRCEHIALPKTDANDAGTDRGDYIFAVQFYKR